MLFMGLNLSKISEIKAVSKITGHFGNYYRVWIAGIVVISLVFLFTFGGNGLYYTGKMRSDVNLVKYRNDSLKAEIDTSRALIDAIDSGDKKTIERIARTYNMGFPGEKSFIVIKSDSL